MSAAQLISSTSTMNLPVFNSNTASQAIQGIKDQAHRDAQTITEFFYRTGRDSSTARRIPTDLLPLISLRTSADLDEIAEIVETIGEIYDQVRAGHRSANNIEMVTVSSLVRSYSQLANAYQGRGQGQLKSLGRSLMRLVIRPDWHTN